MDFDEQQYETIVRNLVANAIKYSDKPGVIQVQIQILENGTHPNLTLSVSDQGIGIPGDMLDRIFDRLHPY